MPMNPYIQDILDQPDALRKATEKFSSPSLARIQRGLTEGEFDRILITGMGASFNAAYPALIRLSKSALPALLVNTAELIHYLGGLLGPRTLLWINSQSGRTAEALHLLERVKSNPPGCILACVNDETSPLAAAADICTPIHAGHEATVGTKTYTNTLAVNLLTAGVMLGDEIETLKGALSKTAEAIEAYLEDWQARFQELEALLPDCETTLLIGRGASMSAVWNGALINKEAAKCSFEGMQAAEFRHGPLELVDPGFCAFVFAGHPSTAPLNRKLALEIIQHGGRALWLDAHSDPSLPTIRIPETDETTRPVGEILPMQILSLVMAQRKGIVPGRFRIVDKVTARE